MQEHPLKKLCSVRALTRGPHLISTALLYCCTASSSPASWAPACAARMSRRHARCTLLMSSSPDGQKARVDDDVAWEKLYSLAAQCLTVVQQLCCHPTGSLFPVRISRLTIDTTELTAFGARKDLHKTSFQFGSTLRPHRGSMALLLGLSNAINAS